MNTYRKIDTTTGLFIEDVLLDSPPILIAEVPTVQGIFDVDGSLIRTETIIEIRPVLDANGKTIPDPQYIDVECPAGFYKPKWDGVNWVEGFTQAEIDAIKITPKEPTDEERISALEDAMLYLI